MRPSLLDTDILSEVLKGHDLIGQPIGRADPMIAAIAIQHGLVLVSGNSNHFRRITDLGYQLELEHWRMFQDAG